MVSSLAADFLLGFQAPFRGQILCSEARGRPEQAVVVPARRKLWLGEVRAAAWQDSSGMEHGKAPPEAVE